MNTKFNRRPNFDLSNKKNTVGTIFPRIYRKELLDNGKIIITDIGQSKNGVNEFIIVDKRKNKTHEEEIKLNEKKK